MGLGSLLAISILANSAVVFGPANVNPEFPGSAALEAAIPFGKWGLILALFGMLFAVAGAAVETCLANAYSIAQFFGWKWGRHKRPWEAPRFTLTWILLFLVALGIVLTGIDLLPLVESVLFSVLVPAVDVPAAAPFCPATRALIGLSCDRRDHPRRLGWFILCCHCRCNGGVAALFPDLGRQWMKPSDPIKLVSQLLDLPIVDSEGAYCGVVDDIELAGRAQQPLEVKALMIGPGAYAGRLPRSGHEVVRITAGGRVVRVPLGKIRTTAQRCSYKSQGRSRSSAKRGSS